MSTLQPRSRSWLGLLLPALLAFIVLVGLGTWQVERKAWKEALIATLTERLAAPPQALPAPATWQNLDPSSDEYRRVKFTFFIMFNGFNLGNESIRARRAI